MSEKYRSIKILESLYEELMELRNQYSIVLGRTPTFSETIKLLMDKAGEFSVSQISNIYRQKIEEKEHLIMVLNEFCKKSRVPDEVALQLIKKWSESLESLNIEAIKVLRHILEKILLYTKETQR
jgi:phosphomevalonate kinase